MNNASRPIDNTSLALGEMREFMTHHRQQMDKVTERLSEHSDTLRRLQHDQEMQLVKIDQTSNDVSEIKVSLQSLCDAHKTDKVAKEVSRKSMAKGIGIGIIAMTLFASIYFKDTTFMQTVYKHTLGLFI